jgi:hypothetical protein
VEVYLSSKVPGPPHRIYKLSSAGGSLPNFIGKLKYSLNQVLYDQTPISNTFTFVQLFLNLQWLDQLMDANL